MESGISTVIVSMNFALLFLLVIALGLLSALLLAFRSKGVPVKSLAELENSAHKVDLPAFRNLVDVEEESFLRAHLYPGEFRRIQRQRMRAAAEYVRRTAQNASAVLSLGEAVRLQADPEAAEAGRKLLDCAATLRLNATLALIVLNLRIIFPGMRWSLAQVIEGYERFSSAAERVIQLQGPAYTRPVSAAV
jgi:hypothetical protein